MPKPQFHVIVCTNSRPPGHPRGSCAEKGSQEVLMQFFEELQQRNLFEKVLVTGSTCTGPCMLGPTVIVYPDGVWYQRVRREDVPTMVTEHLMQGKPVERLRLPDEVWG
ncbi:MAG: (2Fe-2S) ferredoxin domain-containing protein [Nitrospirae bacterium]|nr:(2Fe-2S) ferredoxin domain-containing protein [Nitrospirota bacterium]